MTRDEALKILDIEDAGPEKDEDGHLTESVDPKIVMERFETLIDKNQVGNGGSFYL